MTVMASRADGRVGDLTAGDSQGDCLKNCVKCKLQCRVVRFVGIVTGTR